MRDVRVRPAPPAPHFAAPLLACCAGKRLRVSSAPHPGGFEPHALGPNKNGPLARTVSNSMVGDEGCRVRLTPSALASGLRPSRAALENASRFLSSAPLRVRIPPLAHKKAPWAVMGLGRSVLMAGTEGFEPPTAGTKNRSSTVELRPNVWCCPKATRLVYLICEGIANAIE